MKYIKHLIMASKYSIMGVQFALKNENAARMELIAIIVAMIGAYFIALNMAEYILLIGIVILVFAVEMLNTAIEAIVDEDGRRTKLYGAAKDCGSAAVGILVLLGLFIWVALILLNVVGV